MNTDKKGLFRPGRVDPLFVNCEENKLYALVYFTLSVGEFEVSIMCSTLRDWSSTQLGHSNHMHISPHLNVASHSLGHDSWLFMANSHPGHSLRTYTLSGVHTNTPNSRISFALVIARVAS